MNAYRIVHPLLNLMSAESAHRAALAALRINQSSKPLLDANRRNWADKVPDLPVEIFGRKLRNPIGLAAGFDKDAQAIDAIAAMGFGLVEVGTVTPEPQPGNSGKRIFRIADDRAIINRLGFNSRGLEAFRNQLRKRRKPSDSVMLGVNIGKNADTDLDQAIEDYETCMRGVYEFADYIAINISSPNTPELRHLQFGTRLSDLLSAIMARRDKLAASAGHRKVPVAVKLSPDLRFNEIKAIAEVLMERKVDAVIATNTTVTRPQGDANTHLNYEKSGGLSGPPLSQLSTQVLYALAKATELTIPIIGVGGVSTAQDAWEKMVAGASAVQLYSSLAYGGPIVVRDIVEGLLARVAQYPADSLEGALAIARSTRS